MHTHIYRPIGTFLNLVGTSITSKHSISCKGSKIVQCTLFVKKLHQRNQIFEKIWLGQSPTVPLCFRRACTNSVANIQGGISLSCDTLQYDIVFIECTIFNSNFFYSRTESFFSIYKLNGHPFYFYLILSSYHGIQFEIPIYILSYLEITVLLCQKMSLTIKHHFTVVF